jgi:hypothetical protein
MTYDEMLEQLKDAYANLLIVQYHDQPNAIATIKANIEILLSNMLLWKIRDCWDIDDTELCIGAQLDIIGKWVGVDRYFVGPSFGGDFYIAFYDEDTITEPNANQGCLRDEDEITVSDGAFILDESVISVTNRLNDDDFRLLIKLKIIKNNTIMSCKNIDDSIFKLFANDVFTTWNNIRANCLAFYDEDSADEPTQYQLPLLDEDNMSLLAGSFLSDDEINDVMTVTYNYLKSNNAIIELAKQKNCLPVPTGCKIKLQEIA